MTEIVKRKASTDKLNNKSNKNRKQPVPLGLIDLNHDCLMKLFEDFSVNDLVNVTEADSRLIAAARDVFRRKYGTFMVKVFNNFNPKTETTSWSEKLLKHFGEVITNLNVVYHEKYYRFNERLDDMILMKCRKSLIQIQIENADPFMFHKIDKPFEKMLAVRFVSSEIPDMIHNFEKWFPNADTMELKELKIKNFIESENKKGSQIQGQDDTETESEGNSEDDTDFIKQSTVSALAKKYPTVKHFAISNVPKVYKFENRVRNHNIKSFIELNPQLRSLFIESDDIDHDNEEMWEEAGYSASWSYDGIEFEESLADCIQENLPNLENVHLIWKTGEAHEGCEIYFEQLKTLTIEYEIRRGHFYVATDNVDILNIVAKSAGHCSDLIQWNKMAKVIKISGDWCGKREIPKVFKQLVKLPNLKELRFSYENQYIQKKNIITLLSSCKQLIKLTLDFGCSKKKSEATQFEKEFNNGVDVHEIGWKIEYQKSLQKHHKIVFERIVDNSD